MGIRDFLPFRQAPTSHAKRAQILDVDSQNALVKLFKVTGLALGLTGSLTYGSRSQFESSPYDFDRIIQAVDTDSFVKQTFNKYKELLWKEGWDIIGENPQAVEYLYQRIDFMEFAMRRPFEDLLVEIGDQLLKFGNAFVAKSRGDLGQYYPSPLTPPEGKDPVMGYYVVPAETIEIERDKHNRVRWYRQSTEKLVTGFTTERRPRWRPEEMIHFCVDRKPGRVFGTPFMVAVMDDVVALRQIEEDVQNLVHKELFPLYKYKVGTEEHPADPEEIDQAAEELTNLRTDGGLVLPERHDVDVIGAENTALDASPYLTHFLGRVCAGLGISPHHLGLMLGSANRAVTDRLDIALYDKVKNYQRYIEGMIRLHMFSELLLEGGYDPITTPKATGISDRCLFRFREIDVDTQVKKENHIIQKFTSNGITHPEFRLALGLDPDAEEDLLFVGMQTRMQMKTLAAQAAAQPKKPDAQTSSKGGTRNLPAPSRGPSNVVRPANQHGRRLSPNIRHYDETWLTEVEELLEED